MAGTDLTSLLYGDPGTAPSAQPPPPAPPAPSSAAVVQAVTPSGIGSDARYPVSPPMGWNPPPLNPVDRDNLIKTIYGEASGEPALGQAGVAHAILNRVNAGGYTGGAPNTITNVVHAPAFGENPAHGFKEFSPWNAPGVPESNPTAQHLPATDPNYIKIGHIVDQVYSGAIPDPTGGATHYYGYMPHPPKWAPPLAALNTTKIGGQTFIGGYAGHGQTLPPTQTASNQQE
jgi:spore germination cell wall hydrolase CwlJ-like protein